MKTRTILVIAMSIAFIVSSPIWACTAAGPSTHVGKVLKIDQDNKTFTILDAQTVSPVTFKANGDILEKVTNASGTAFVDFDTDGAVLTATEVTFK
jgi:hypothetical protein